jgi:hypothetical protein
MWDLHQDQDPNIPVPEASEALPEDMPEDQ